MPGEVLAKYVGSAWFTACPQSSVASCEFPFLDLCLLNMNRVSRTPLFSLFLLGLVGGKLGWGCRESPEHSRGARRPEPRCPSHCHSAPVHKGFDFPLTPKVDRSLMNHS